MQQGKWTGKLGAALPSLEKYIAIYKDLHQYPELPCQESRTAAIVAHHLRSLEYHVQTNIAGHGVVGILFNGAGKTVLLRSGLDAFPMQEDTGLPYVSQVRQVDEDGMIKPVMHGSGQDMNIAGLLGTADLLMRLASHWSGTVVCLFQPNEERFLGAQAMIDDGLFNMIPLPDIILGQHASSDKAGTISVRKGRVLGFLTSLAIRVYGRPTHSSTPHRGVDPILVAGCMVSRLQMVVSREIDCKERCAVTCGYFHSGTDASVIPEFADFTVDIRSFDENVQQTAVNAVKRIIEAECVASNSPSRPRIVTKATCPPVDNDPKATAIFMSTMHAHYGREGILEMDTTINADDFAVLAHPPRKKPIPYVYWTLGVTPPEVYNKAKKDGTLLDLPSNHSPKFAADIKPSLAAGIGGLVIASLAFLAP